MFKIHELIMIYQNQKTFIWSSLKKLISSGNWYTRREKSSIYTAFSIQTMYLQGSQTVDVRKFFLRKKIQPINKEEIRELNRINSI